MWQLKTSLKLKAHLAKVADTDLDSIVLYESTRLNYREQTMIGEQKLTWRQVIRREVNQMKKSIVETAEYKPFILG